MRNNHTPLRPALTAIAAVMALSSTAAFAQDAQTAPATDAPVISAPAPVIAAPAQQSVISENTSAPIESAAPAAPMATQSTPVVHTTADTGKDIPAPAAKAAAPAKRVAPAETRTAAPAAAFTPAAAPKVAEAAPAPVAPPTATPEPAPVPAPVAKTTTTQSTTTASNDNREIELAGAGAVGLIVLIGGAVALSRRKRNDEEVFAPAVVTTAPVEPVQPVTYEAVSTAPVTVAPVVAESAAIEGAPTTPLHKDFDISRYGPYVQQAYRGPTEDNPSLSLRHRLKRARFMDQRARETGEYVPETTPAMAAERKVASSNLIGSKLKDGLRSLRPQPNMRPAFG